jgi:hypothetical protein
MKSKYIVRNDGLKNATLSFITILHVAQAVSRKYRGIFTAQAIWQSEPVCLSLGGRVVYRLGG